MQLIDNAISALQKEAKDYESFIVVDGFNIYLQLKEYSKCELLIQESIKLIVFKNPDHSKFLKVLLSNFLHNEPIYIYETDFSSGSLLAKQMMVINHLSFGDNDLAQIYWNQLSIRYPNIYKSDFNYQGHFGLFSLALKKHQSVARPSVKLSVTHSSKGSVKDKFIFILENNQAQLDRYEIMSLLWPDEEYSTKLEKRLNSLVSKLRRERKVAIKLRPKYLDTPLHLKSFFYELE